MKRDINLVRDILFSVENDEDPIHLDFMGDQIFSHLELLVNCGLLNGVQLGKHSWGSLTLTWEGHELLELIRDLDRWATIKRVLDDLNCYSFEIIKQIAVQQMKL